MSTARHHAEWLSLVEVSGPFLSLPVLLRAFPQGLDAHDPALRARLHLACEEWQGDQAGRRPDPALHRQWIRFVLQEVLGYREDDLGQALPPALTVAVAQHGATLQPTYAILDPPGRGDPRRPRLLVATYPKGQPLESAVRGSHWQASPATRMQTLLRATALSLGLVTNGDHWLLVHVGEATTFAAFYTPLWFEEPLTLRAFRSLLSAHRLFGVPDDQTLPALLAASLDDQQELTDQLGYQVRTAVEVLIQAIDRIDRDQGHRLLHGFDERHLYDAAVTLMMRVVFLLAAEEHGLILAGNPIYEQHYALSPLRAQLQGQADRHGEEVLERRFDAWSRLLATFRAIYGGIHHEDLKLPAYGGSLFDPDRYPFLEGRPAATSWRDTPADPLAIDNRTVLLTATHLPESRWPPPSSANSKPPASSPNKAPAAAPGTRRARSTTARNLPLPRSYTTHVQSRSATGNSP